MVSALADCTAPLRVKAAERAAAEVPAPPARLLRPPEEEEAEEECVSAVALTRVPDAAKEEPNLGTARRALRFIAPSPLRLASVAAAGTNVVASVADVVAIVLLAARCLRTTRARHKRM